MLGIVARTAVCTSLIEYLNTYGKEIEYDFTKPEYFGSREISVFLVKGSDLDLDTISNFIYHTYDTDNVISSFYILNKEETQIGERN